MWQRHVGVFYILLRIEMGSEQRMRRTAFLMTNALWGVQGLCISTADLVSYPHVLEITSGGSLGLGFQFKWCSPKAVNKISLVVTRQEVLGGVERHLQYMTYMTWCLPSLLCNTFLFTIYSVNNRLSFILHATYLSLSNKSYFTRWTCCYVEQDELTVVTICRGYRQIVPVFSPPIATHSCCHCAQPSVAIHPYPIGHWAWP